MKVQTSRSRTQIQPIKNQPAAFFSRDAVLLTLKEAVPMLLKRFQGREVDISVLPAFQQSDMALHTQHRDIFEKTDIEMTLRLDISQALQVYERDMSRYEGASFTLFMMWSLVRAMGKVPEFNFRYIDDKWYEFKNLPLFTTLSADASDPRKLNNLLIENFSQLSWGSACQHYHEGKFAMQQTSETTQYPYPLYAIATHITNVRLPLTHASGPMPKKGMEIERPNFLLGERKITESGATMPLSVKLPHASLNPALLEKLIFEWKVVLAHSNLCRPKL